MNKLGTERCLRCRCKGEGMKFIKHLLDEKCSHPGISIHYQSNSGRWIESVLSHCRSDRVQDTAQSTARSQQMQDLECEDGAEVSFVPVLTSPLTHP